MNDFPDDRALATYKARALDHARTIALLNDTLACLRGHAVQVPFALRLEALREQSHGGLRVMAALMAAWHRDLAERQVCRDQRAKDIQQRFETFAR